MCIKGLTCWVKTPYLPAGRAGLQRRVRKNSALQRSAGGDHVHTVGCNHGRYFRGHTENTNTLPRESGKHIPRRRRFVLFFKKIKVGGGFQGEETRCAKTQGWASGRGLWEVHTALFCTHTRCVYTGLRLAQRTNPEEPVCQAREAGLYSVSKGVLCL